MRKFVMTVINRMPLFKEGRETTPDLATSPRRQAQGQGTNGAHVRPKEPPPMVIQGDFRKVSDSDAFTVLCNRYN